MQDHRRQVRWEAAKALRALLDPQAAPVLVQALDDKDDEVSWIAGGTS